MAGATKADGMAQIIYVSPTERNIVQTEDEGKDLRGKPSLKPTVDFTAIWLSAMQLKIFSVLIWTRMDWSVISLEEAMETRGNNDTIDEFKQVDVDNDGYVHPSEFDQSLV